MMEHDKRAAEEIRDLVERKVFHMGPVELPTAVEIIAILARHRAIDADKLANYILDCKSLPDDEGWFTTPCEAIENWENCGVEHDSDCRKAAHYVLAAAIRSFKEKQDE